MTKNKYLVALLLLVTLPLCSQTAQKEIFADVHRAASNYYAYPESDVQAKLTPAPAGFKPVYISAYARHGSRYLINPNDYKRPLATLQKADSAGVLTEAGKQVLVIVDSLNKMAVGRYGELTPLGARQHQGIARRMFFNFPEVFKSGADVNARSTPVVRCILSMLNECTTLKALCPSLDITTDASQHDMYYMNDEFNAVTANRSNPEARASLSNYYNARVRPDHLLKELFSDEEYAKKINGNKLMGQLFDLASNLQSHDVNLDLFRYFTKEECYDLWLRDNYDWYVNYGPSPLTNGKLPYTQANLLRNILDTADTCLIRRKTGATLRFGHEVCILPLACLLELNACGYRTTNPDSVAIFWRNYRIFPMASNIQFIFYRNDARQLLVKVLLNERETRLPVPSKIAPYYNWSDVEAYYRKKLENQ